MNDMNDDYKIMHEMIGYIEENNWSFYELGAYAFNQDKHDWVRMLRSRKKAHILSLACRSKKYNKPFTEAFNEYMDARINYMKRHTTDLGTWKE